MELGIPSGIQSAGNFLRNTILLSAFAVLCACGSAETPDQDPCFKGIVQGEDIGCVFTITKPQDTLYIGDLWLVEILNSEVFEGVSTPVLPTELQVPGQVIYFEIDAANDVTAICFLGSTFDIYIIENISTISCLETESN